MAPLNLGPDRENAHARTLRDLNAIRKSGRAAGHLSTSSPHRRLTRRVIEVVPDAHLHGPAPGEGRLPGNAHLGFPGCEGDSLLMLLDARGIECSTGSACSAGVPQPSHVLIAMGCRDDQARHSLRFSLGHTSRESDVDAVVEAIGPAVERARAARA